jgi:glycosyltransferase involved in cell wall biosynthesis
LENDKVSIIIPAYNEVDRIGETVRSVLPFSKDIIVIDDGSKDGTASEARKEGVKVVRLSRNMGKGWAVKAGFLLSRGEILLILDADLGSSARKALSLVPPVLKGEADMTIADLPKRRGGFGFVLALSRFGVKLLTGRDMKSPISGQRALRREVLEGFPWERRFGFETALTIYALRKGYRVKEIPLNITHRRTGWSWKGFIHRGKQFIHILFALLKILIRR